MNVAKISKFWLRIGVFAMTCAGFQYVDVLPDKSDNVVGVTFTSDENYLKVVGEIEL